MPENCINLISTREWPKQQKRIIQTPSKVSEFDQDLKIVALLSTEMLKVKCKGVNKSKFGSFGSAICCSAQFCLYLLCSKPVKPGHYRALRAHILGVLLTIYGEMAQQWNNKWKFITWTFRLLWPQCFAAKNVNTNTTINNTPGDIWIEKY